MKFVHLHIPKTAGTSLRERLIAAHDDLDVRQVHHPVPDTLPDSVDVASGHFSFHDAERFGGDVVTVLRHPVDRFVSCYYFWRELHAAGVEGSRKTALAHALPLAEFARALDEPELVSELYNRMAWQLHSDFALPRRADTRIRDGLDEAGLVAGALDNLGRCAVVGFQHRYGDFLAALNARFDLAITNVHINVTARRSAIEDLTRAELSAILNWVAADMELYTAARARFGGQEG
ncbi:MAG: sulfotransferase family 2 domain-containing protein [Marinibacterium sp.]